MEPMLKIFAVCFLFLVCNRVNAQYCSPADLAVTQTVLPGKVNGQTVYTVAVENRCICSQDDIKLACPGFNSSIPVDKQLLRPDDDGKLCTLNNGFPISMGPEYAVKFSYAWSSHFSFVPVSSTIACS